jgi:hypothetical protein
MDMEGNCKKLYNGIYLKIAFYSMNTNELSDKKGNNLHEKEKQTDAFSFLCGALKLNVGKHS